MAAAEAMPPPSQDIKAVCLNGLSFAYPGCEPSLKDINLDLPRGSRCLLIGANGAGEGYIGLVALPRTVLGWAGEGREGRCGALLLLVAAAENRTPPAARCDAAARCTLHAPARCVAGTTLPCTACYHPRNTRPPRYPPGKTTLLQLLAGKYMVGRSAITVLGRSPFFDLVRLLAC